MSEGQKEENAKQREQSSLIDKLKRQAGKGIEKLRDNLQGKLRNLTLEELAELTQAIGTEINQVFLSLTAIATELIRRTKKEGPFTAKAEAGGIVKTKTILSTMSQEEVEEEIGELKRFIDESDAPIETKSLVFFKVDSSPEKTSQFQDVKDELQGFEQELSRLKGEK